MANTSSNVSYLYTDEPFIFEGRVEVCDNSSYSSLCSEYWDPVDAQVFCEYYLQYNYGIEPERICMS